MQAANKISFAEDVKSPSIITPMDSEERQRKMSNSSEENNRLRRLSTNSSIPEDAVFDPNDPSERGHKQNWTKTTADKDTWAHQERRRMSGWSNTDVANYKHMEGRRGSVLSMWAPGKDKDGNDVLFHNDDHDKSSSAIDDNRSESGSGRSVNGNGNGLQPGSPKSNSRRASSNQGQERRGSILSLWKGGKDKHGNDVMGGDDEEWK